MYGKNFCRNSHEPQGNWRFINGDEAGGIEGTIPEVMPALNHTGNSGGVVVVSVTGFPNIPSI